MNTKKKEVILAGDIGGTNARLALIEVAKGRLAFVAEQTFASREEPSLESVLRKFTAQQPRAITRACVGVAGPVRQGRCEATNLPWIIDAQVIARQLHLSQAGLINDLAAQAFGIAELEEKDFELLNPGAADPQGNCALIAAGTGLGQAGLVRLDKRLRPFATEGGHADFAPRNRQEMALLEYLLKRHTRVSAERVLSGMGLVNIYLFLKDTGQGDEPPWLAEQMHLKEPAAVISQNALEGRSSLCAQALDLFASLYGAEAGNLALKLMATGGVYLGGGIAPKIIAKLREPVFMNAFTAKGRMKPLLQAMPVRVILNPKTALLGAARYALL
ncbi:MAG: glucokinase [Desulfobacteraceae bacterium]|nr:glucokinase [Desulfobacteraceae bacterium]